MNHKHLLFPAVIAFVISLLFMPAGCHRNSGDYVLVWQDEFDYSGLPDSNRWSFDTAGNARGWGNKEAQYYTANRLENAMVKDGKLFITARKEEYAGHKYTSARLRTKGKGDWLYGKIAVRAKLPDGRGLWPAIWMLPTDWVYGGWPASGEIDIMENVGFDPDTIHAAIHTKAYNHITGTQKHGKISIPDNRTAFHVYSVEWDTARITVFVDDTPYFTYRKEGQGYEVWPFDRRFHLLLNVAVGGTWGGKYGIDDAIFPQSMVIDWVRVYRLF